jgi:hypothetical protein
MSARPHDRHHEYQAHARTAEDVVADVLARVSTIVVIIAAAFLGASF